MAISECLSAEAVEGLSLSFQGVDDVKSSDCLSLGVFGVGDRISDNILEEDLEDSSSFFVNQTGDSLDASTSSQTADCWFGDTLDVIPKDFSVTLGASLSKTFSSFASS